MFWSIIYEKYFLLGKILQFIKAGKNYQAKVMV